MKNTRKILFSAALLSSGLTMAQTTTAEKSPNVIYIMADDLGIGDLGLSLIHISEPTRP